MTKHQVREKNPNWKGGRVVDPRGYILIKVGKDHPLADVRGYAYEHRLEAEKKLGRRLRKKEEVHHKSSRSDNSHDKIEIAKNKLYHAVFHRKRSDLRMPGERNRSIACACGCGTSFRKFDKENRPRKFISGHNLRRPR